MHCIPCAKRLVDFYLKRSAHFWISNSVSLWPSPLHLSPQYPHFWLPTLTSTDWLASVLRVTRTALLHNATPGLSHHVMDIFTWLSPLSQPNRFPALFSLSSLPYSCLLPLRPQAVSAPLLPFSEGHSLILVSINADPVTHWPESFSSDIGTQKPSLREGCVLGAAWPRSRISGWGWYVWVCVWEAHASNNARGPQLLIISIDTL